MDHGKAVEAVMGAAGASRSDAERFLASYCGKCGKRCDEVDPRYVGRLYDGTVMCSRYVCAVLVDWGA